MTLPFLLLIAAIFAAASTIAFFSGYLTGRARGYDTGYRRGIAGRAAAWREAEVTAVVRR